MNKNILDLITNPEDLKDYSYKQLNQLAAEIRTKIIELSKTKDIHLSSNLGVIELTIALLKNFNPKTNVVVYDTGHQTYTHKMLTGRNHLIHTIRSENGLAGFTDINESEYDHYSPGHAGNILSVLSGMYAAENKNKHPKKNMYFNNKNYVGVVGDSSFANGLSFEALNDISFNKDPLIIILNDNGMSISKSVGALSKSFATVKNTDLFHFVERFFRKVLNFNSLYYAIFNAFNRLESMILSKNIFQNLGYYYIGPVDGHNIKKMDKFLKRAKWFAKQGAIIVHVKTIKGKGLKEAENDLCGQYHSKINNAAKTYGQILTSELLKMMRKHSNISVINPAMTHSSNCEIIEQEFPDRYDDVGIAEEHAISKASGMSLVGLKPYVFIYSSFLQRAYDQLSHDLARLHLNATLLIDRSDLSGGDGSSHHGIYDVSFLKTIHNTLICMGRNIDQNKQLLAMSYKYNDGIFALRYPKSDFKLLNINSNIEIKLGKWEFFEDHNSDTIIMTYGPYFNEIYDKFYTNYKINMVNCIFITKYDKTQLNRILKQYKNILVYERIGGGNGLVNDVYKAANQLRTNNKIIEMNYKKIVQNGSTEGLDRRNQMGLNDINKILKQLA